MLIKLLKNIQGIESYLYVILPKHNDTNPWLSNIYIEMNTDITVLGTVHYAFISIGFSQTVYSRMPSCSQCDFKG